MGACAVAGDLKAIIAAAKIRSRPLLLLPMLAGSPSAPAVTSSHLAAAGAIVAGVSRSSLPEPGGGEANAAVDATDEPAVS